MTNDTLDSARIKKIDIRKLDRIKGKARGSNVTFSDVHQEGDQVVGTVEVDWTEQLFGGDVTLLQLAGPFSTDGEVILYDDDFWIGPMPVDVVLRVYLVDFHNVCAEGRAYWIGGNLGDTVCHAF